MAIAQLEALATRGKVLRKGNDGAPKQGCGRDNHVITGSGGTTAAGLEYRAFVDFAAIVWKPMAKIVKIELALKVEDDSSHFVYGATPKIAVNLLKAPFHDGTNAENVWTADEWEVNPDIWSGQASLTIPLDNTTEPPRPPDGQFVYVDVTTLCKPIVGINTHMPDGSVGLGKVIHGFLIHAVDLKAPKQRAIFYSWHATTASNRPKLVITYETANAQPTAPSALGPTGDVSWAAVFTGKHNDPDGDPMSARLIRVWNKPPNTEPAWKLDSTLTGASSEETQAGTFSVPLSLATGSLNLGTDYEWDAATRDSKGAPADWANATYSAKTALKITSSAPSVTPLPVGSVAAMAGTLFGGTYLDPQGNPMDRFRIQVGLAGADWTVPGEVLWDTGEAAPTAAEVAASKVARAYGGLALTAGSYDFRFAARDSTGVWSPWVEAAWSLTAPYNPDLGEVFPTTQMDRKPPVRIALWSVFTDAAHTTVATGRGRGLFIGYLDDPIDMGMSAYLNAGGELYFSLPALHPYCPEIEPHKVHYAIEQYYGDRFRAIANGIITDFDSDADTVTFYGTDYLGLLQTAVDERYDPNGPDKPADGLGGGFSKYVDRTIDYVIKDQIRYHKKQANSPVTFIAEAPVARFDALPERVTIHSTYAECLPFINGLMDSHKQGTGKEARFYVRPTNPEFTAFEFSLKDNWGVDRPDIHLEYGQIITDFRVVALGDFGTRVLGVGQKRGEVKVYRATGVATGMDESKWGRRAQTRFYQDIIDQNDLQRRVNEDANVLAKIGKRMALAFKADALTPFDGWDLGDSIIIDIRRGVVDSMGYGSNGLMTIYGVEWRYSQDGHSDLTLTTLPKKTATSAPSDLIPSVNPGLSYQWQTGFGIPSSYGEPPGPTPAPGVLSLAATPRALGPQERMLSNASSPASSSAGDYTVASEFTVLVDGQISHLRYYHYGDPAYAHPAGHTHALSLWKTDGTKVAGVIDTPPSDANAFRDVALAVPVAVTAGTYRVSFSCDSQPSQAASSGVTPASLAPHLTLSSTAWYATGRDLFPNNAQAGVHRFADVVYQSGTPDAGLPLTTEPVNAFRYADLNTGCIYELDEATGLYDEIYCPIHEEDLPPPYAPDIEAPSIPVIESLTSTIVVQEDGTNLAGIYTVVGYPSPPGGLTDLSEVVVQATRFADQSDPPVPDWTRAVNRIVPSSDSTGTIDTTVVLSPVVSATPYWGRAAAIDVSGNRSGWSPVVLVQTASDDVAPPLPQGIVVMAGMGTIGLAWDPSPAPDYSYTEVQWREAPAGNWASLQNTGTLVVIAGLKNDVLYNTRLRSVDSSGNVLWPEGPPLPSGALPSVKAEAEPEIGWVAGADATPTALPADSLVWDSAMIENILAGQIDADWIVAGTLRVGVGSGNADAIEVYDSAGNLVGRWSTSGIEILDPANPGYKMVIDEASLTIYRGFGTPDEEAAVTLTPLGIDAGSVTFGSARGGHNLVQNSSFEMGKFGVVTTKTSAWDLAADWNAAGSRQGADVNVTTNASTITMTVV